MLYQSSTNTRSDHIITSELMYFHVKVVQRVLAVINDTKNKTNTG